MNIKIETEIKIRCTGCRHFVEDLHDCAIGHDPLFADEECYDMKDSLRSLFPHREKEGEYWLCEECGNYSLRSQWVEDGKCPVCGNK